jgi:DNA (cytosine-5)-methyltransferase 1
VRGQLSCLDLFCGCGGFTLGLERAGFRVLAAIDSNREAIAALQANLPGVVHAFERDLTAFAPQELAALVGTRQVDVIVGGPPCQGFSKARRVDGSNHGPRLKPDPRRHLYREFLRYVDFFQPCVFVMENVLGLRNAAGGAYFTAVQKEARELGRAAGKPGYRVHGQVEDAWELGVPQKRCRQLIIGVRNDLPGYFLPELKPAPRAVSGSAGASPAPVRALAERNSRAAQPSDVSREARNTTPEGGCAPHPNLWDAIGDLPILRAGGGEPERDYDFARRVDHVQQQGNTALRYLCDVLEIDRADKLTSHTARTHSERELGDFAKLKEGENSAQAMRRGVAFDYPYDKTSFKDRYTRQSRWHPCSTIVAHLSKDGLMFIHPTQNRSLTPREAARIQSFPDWFRFPASRTQAYRLIGNAVPPLVAEAVGLAVKEFLGSTAALAVSFHPLAGRNPARTTAPEMSGGAPNTTREGACAPLSRSRHTVARKLERLARLDRRALRALPKEEFLRGWHALLFLFPGLHPDNALDHGDDIEEIPTDQLGLPGFEQLLARRHARSGWPVALELIGREAWRRYEHGELADDEFYCVAAQRAGLEPQATRQAPGRRATKEQPA